MKVIRLKETGWTVPEMNDTLINLKLGLKEARRTYAVCSVVFAEISVNNEWGETLSAFTDYFNYIFQETWFHDQ